MASSLLDLTNHSEPLDVELIRIDAWIDRGFASNKHESSLMAQNDNDSTAQKKKKSILLLHVVIVVFLLGIYRNIKWRQIVYLKYIIHFMLPKAYKILKKHVVTTE